MHFKIREQVWEEDKNIAHYFEGIYIITLNRAINIHFIPEFMNAINSKVEVILDDDVKSEISARLQTATYASYIITTHPNKTIPFEELALEEDEKVTFFYVSKKDFELYKSELEETTEIDGDIEKEKHNYHFINFISETIFSSSKFSPYQKKILGLP